MKHRLIRRASAGALVLTVLGASAAAAAGIDTNAVLGTSAAVPTLVSAGDNAFDIQVTATGNLAPDKPGSATITSKYFMATNGAITPSAQSADQQALQFTTDFNYSQCPETNAPKGCSSNPFVVHATLVVASGTVAGTAGVLTVGNTGSEGLTADGTPDTGFVKVAGTVNQAPTTPGAPTLQAGMTPNNTGTFTVAWTRATDPDVGDSVTYTLQKRDADDADWTTVASSLSATSYDFAGVVEGSWRFRVQAADTHGATSAWAEDATPIVVVDTSAPAAPTGAADRAPDYTAGDGSAWWKDSVTVSFSDNGDPALSDGSAGSGVASTTDPQTHIITGPFSASGTSTDHATNESVETTVTGFVDADAPSVEFTTCPGTVYFGDMATATWSAGDVGAGLDGVASGSVTLDTSSKGARTATQTVKDLVGHQSTANCDYEVKAWTLLGFYQPVDMSGVLNTVKAGSTVPLKFEIFAGANELTTTSSVMSFTTQQIACDLGAAQDAIEITTTGGTSLRYDTTGGQFIQNWQTPKKPGNCYKATMTTQDGSYLKAYFQLK